MRSGSCLLIAPSPVLKIPRISRTFLALVLYMNDIPLGSSSLHALVLNYAYLCWCILSRLLISMICLSSWHYTSEGIVSETLLHDYFGSFLNNAHEGSTSHYIKTSDSFSPWNNSVSCEDLKGVGSLNTTCFLNSTLYWNADLYLIGTGNLEILPHVSVLCPFEGCSISFNISGNVKVGQYAAIVAGSVVVSATNLTLDHHSSINTTSLGGPPPSQTSGTPISHDGAGGGHGGRGASCLKSNQTNFWGGDVYAWSTLSEPWGYGSQGGSTSAEKHFGGKGGGRVMLKVKDVLYLNGSVTAEGGEGGLKGGGGSGGSIIVNAIKL
ncbi:hypothetical protein HHK36_033425 [Tetracentron sinense]|uniref:Uncharacterized protein n=1 Tax=Tetracentron sinense TaxID=13715 RepID=A0A834Y9C7_TETSI|nr:hypothetical protein HHK36_033425 [Tetracentron sinense]